MMGFTVITVAQLNRYVKSLLEEQPVLRELYVKGEISNFSTNYTSGHCYFTLKDETAAIRAVMFRSYAQGLPFAPESGMKVVARCGASLYERDGQFQLQVYDLQPDGLGAMYLAMRQLKEKLAAQGLFDESRKKNIPPFPQVVGVVTSPKAAAYRDILAVLERRWPLARVVLSPTAVQGKGAAREMAEALAKLDTQGDCDVIIIGRGGGSAEDLWEFNDEGLACTVSACATPVISAVGHETDYTICDLAADLRAPTPSAAAELAVPDRQQQKQRVAQLVRRLTRYENIQLPLYKERVLGLKYKVYTNSPKKMLERNGQTLLTLIKLLQDAPVRTLERRMHLLEALKRDISRLNPMEILTRGYSVTAGEHGVLMSIAQVSPGEILTTTLADGVIRSAVLEPIGGSHETNSQL